MFCKRYYLPIITLLLVIPIAAQSQTFGIKGGINASNFYVDDLDDKRLRIGVHGGFFSQWELSEGSDFRAELLYSGKGNKAESDGLIDQEARFNLMYLDVPLMFVFNLTEIAEIHLGAYGGYLIDASLSSDGDLGEYSDDISTDNLNSLDWGLLGGAGVNLGNLQIGARYNLGMAKLASSDAAEALLGDGRNAVAQLYAAYYFGDDD